MRLDMVVVASLWYLLMPIILDLIILTSACVCAYTIGKEVGESREYKRNSNRPPCERCQQFITGQQSTWSSYSAKLAHQVHFWQAKFMQVKHENNKLRRKLQRCERTDED